MGGFRPIRHLTGGSGGCFKTRRFEKTAAEEVFPGDALQLLGTGLVTRLTTTSAGTTDIQRQVVGVAARIVADRDGKPKTFDASGKSLFSPGGAADWIDVYVDPDIIYEVAFHASAGQSVIGEQVGTSAKTYTSAVGQSGVVVQAEASAVGGTGPFRIVDISPRSLTPSTGKGSSAGLVEVVISNHAFGNRSLAI